MARARGWAHAAAILAGLAVSVGFLVCLPPAADARARQVFASVDLASNAGFSGQAAARMHRGGVRSVRFAIDWFGIEANQGTYDWHEIDTLIGTLASHGIRALPILFGTPGWAVAGLPANPFTDSTVQVAPEADTRYPPTMTSEARGGWRSFVEAAVRRYGRHGTYWRRIYDAVHPRGRSLPVRTWQIWNEPNIPYNFWPSSNVYRYGALVKLSARSIRTVDPSARVALAGMPGRVNYGGARFLNRLYARVPHIKRYFDIVAFHPYASTAAGSVNQLRQLRRSLRRRDHDRHVSLWVSEISWGSGKRGTSPLNKGPRGQARMLRRLYTELRREHRRLRLWRVSWFDWRDGKPDGSTCGWCGHAGLIDWRNRAKPAWHAYRSFLGNGPHRGR